METVQCPPQLIYHRLMLPNWLRKNADWNCKFTGNDLNLIVEQDTSDWENVFRVPLLPRGKFMSDDADITVKIKVGAIMPPPSAPKRDPMSYMITDQKFCVGIQLLDPTMYRSTGPYRAVEGNWSKMKLRNPNINVSSTESASSTVNPDEFEIMLKPSEYYGTAFCVIDSGHKIVAQYSDSLMLNNGLWLDMYRYKSKEVYTINYIEVEIYKDSPKAASA